MNPLAILQSFGNIDSTSEENHSVLDSPMGIEMSGNPTFAFNRIPEEGIRLSSYPKYFIAVGEYKQGEILDLSKITDAHEIQFEKDQTKVN